MDRQSSNHLAQVEPRSEGERKMDEIRTDMAETRTALADKLEALQGKVLNTVEQTVGTVQETVQAAKQTLDFRYQTEQHPWRMFGLAVLAGTVTGFWLGKQRQPSSSPNGDQSSPSLASWTGGDGRPQRDASLPFSQPTRQSENGLFTEELQQIKGIAIGTGMALLRDLLKEAAPGLSDQINQLVDNATRKAGGTPVTGSPFVKEDASPVHPRAWSEAG